MSSAVAPAVLKHVIVSPQFQNSPIAKLLGDTGTKLRVGKDTSGASVLIPGKEGSPTAAFLLVDLTSKKSPVTFGKEISNQLHAMQSCFRLVFVVFVFPIASLVQKDAKIEALNQFNEILASFYGEMKPSKIPEGQSKLQIMKANSYHNAVDIIIKAGTSTQKSKRTKALLYFHQAEERAVENTANLYPELKKGIFAFGSIRNLSVASASEILATSPYPPNLCDFIADFFAKDAVYEK